MHKNEDSRMSAHWMMNALVKRGVAKEDISNRIGITPEAFENLLDELPYDLYFTIMNWAAELSDNDSLGIDLAGEIDLANMGLYGYLLNNAPTLNDFCETFSQYLSTLTLGSSLQLQRLENSCRISYKILFPTMEDTRHDNEMTLAIAVNFSANRVCRSIGPHQALADSCNKCKQLNDQ